MNIPVYRGRVRQRGYGLGGTLKTVGSNLIPYLVDNMASTLLNEVTGGVHDVIENPKTYKHIAKKRGSNVLKHVTNKLLKDLNEDKLMTALTNNKTKSIKGLINTNKGQSGSGRRKRCNNHSAKRAKKRRLDYFD